MKVAILTICLVLTAVAPSAAQLYPYVPQSNLVAWWPFNGNAVDESGNGNNGTVHGATLTVDRFGFENRSYNFAGEGNHISTNLTAPQGDRTICLWFRQLESNQSENQWRLFSYGGNTAGAGFGIFNNIASQGDRLGIDIGNSYVIYELIPTLNQWHHLAVVYSTVFGNSVADVKVYLDGWPLYEISGSLNFNVLLETGTDNFFSLGQNPNFLPDHFQGDIDDVGIWSQALGQNEILGLYWAGLCLETINVTVTDTLIINVGTTGFNPITDLSTIRIFPNPTNEHLTIDYGNFNVLSGYVLRILSPLQGSEPVFETIITQQADYLNLASLGESGIYIVQLLSPLGGVLATKTILLVQ